MQLLVLTSYPEERAIHSSKTVGVASYTKMLLTSMKQIKPSNSITVFAEVLTKPRTYHEEGITVQRIWRRNTIISLFYTWITLLRRPEKNLLVSYEVYMFGSPLITVFTLFGILLLHVFGKKITIITHQVLGNAHELEKAPYKAVLLTVMKSFLYSLLLTASDQVIVFEEQLKCQLSDSSNVHVIPHLIPEAKNITKENARRVLGLSPDGFYVLYFGYLSPYKGIEDLLHIFPYESGAKLIIAGGPNPNHLTNASYMKYVDSIQKLIQEKHVLATGFVEEEKVPIYFAACDAVILPYTTFMSSSGPLSLACAYEVPVLMADSLRGYTKTMDIATSITKAGLTIEDLTYLRTNSSNLANKLSLLKDNYKKFKEVSRLIKNSRSEKIIAHKFWEVLS